jgi:hypothetical protein
MRKAFGAVLLAVLIGLVAGCGGGSKGPGVASAAGANGAKGATASPTPSLDPEEQRRQFVQCMRDHGVDVPDPDANGGIKIIASAGPGSEKAIEDCQKYLPAGKAGKADPKVLEQTREFTKCMRDHGIDMPDPDPNGGGFRIQKGEGNGAGTGKVNPDDPAFKAAMDACKDKLPKGGQMTTNGDGK